MAFVKQTVRGTELSNKILIAEKTAFPLMRRGCRRFGWASGESALYLGLFLLSFALFNLLLPFTLESQKVLMLYGAQFLVGVVLFLILIPTQLRRSLIAPLGIAILAPKRKSSMFSFLVMTVAIVYFAGSSVLEQSEYIVPILVACVIALIAEYGYLRSGDNLLFFIASLPLIALVMITEKAAFTETATLTLVLLVYAAALLIYGVRKIYSISLLSIQNNVNQLFDYAHFDASSDAERYLSALFFCNYLEPRVIPNLIKLSKDENQVVARTAHLALARMWGPTTEQMQEWITFSLSRLVEKHAGSLPAEAQREIKDMHQKAIDEVEAHYSDVASVFADQIADKPALIDSVIELMKGNDSLLDQQEHAALTEAMSRLLAVTNDHKGFAAIIKNMDLHNPAYTKNLIRALRYGGMQAAPHVAGLLGFPLTWVALEANDVLSQLLYSLSGDEEEEEDLKLARVLSEEKVKEALADERVAVRAHAQWLTSALPEEEAVQRLIKAIQEDSWLVRGEALCAFSELSHEQSLPYVIQALHDAKAYVRVRALQCIEYLKPKGAKELVTFMKNDSSAAVSLTAQQVEKALS